MKLLPRNLVYQIYSYQFALGITGDAQTIEETANLLYNHKFTSNDPIYLSDRFAYNLICKEDLEAGLINYFYCYFDKGQKRGLLKELAKKCANNFIKKIKYEIFLQNNPLISPQSVQLHRVAGSLQSMTVEEDFA